MNHFTTYLQIILTENVEFFMNLFKRKPETTTSLVCRICEMEFSDPERTMRHMIKAHSKPQKAKK